MMCISFHLMHYLTATCSYHNCYVNKYKQIRNKYNKNIKNKRLKFGFVKKFRENSETKKTYKKIIFHWITEKFLKNKANLILQKHTQKINKSNKKFARNLKLIQQTSVITET